MTRANDGWENILDQGEEILWQGRPGPGVLLPIHNHGKVFGGIIVMIVSGAMLVASLPRMGLLTFLLAAVTAHGFYNSFGKYIWRGYLARRGTWYTLTNRRAFIGRRYPFGGRALESYPIMPDKMLDYVPGERPSIFFAHETIVTRNGETRHRIGFEKLEDGAKVYRLMRGIQEGQSA